MSIWQELDGLEKKKAELDGRLLSIDEKEKGLEERLRAIEGEVGILEGHVHKLEVQLKEKHGYIGNLESRIAEIDKIFRKPQPVRVEEGLVEEEPSLKEVVKDELRLKEELESQGTG